MSMLLEQIQKLLEDQNTLECVCNELHTDRENVLEKSKTIYKELPKSAFARLNQLIDDCRTDVDSLRYECEDQSRAVSDALSELESASCDLEYSVDDVSAKLDAIEAGLKEDEEVTEVIDDVTKELINQIPSISEYNDIGKETTNE